MLPGLPANAQQRGARQRDAVEVALQSSADSFGAKRIRARRLDSQLTLLDEEWQRQRMAGVATGRFRSAQPALRLRGGGQRVLIDAVAQSSGPRLRARLETLGMQSASVRGRIVSGWLSIDALPLLDGIEELQHARAAIYRRAAGSALTQGDAAQRSSNLRTDRALSGAGVVVGVLSDSYDCLGGAAGDRASGDLPANINVLRDATAFGCSGVVDEGRAMLQIVHDVAPGASLAFHSAVGGVADYSNGIDQLRQIAGARVIVDDLVYLSEPMFQDGPIAQAVDSAVAQGATYFSAAGNNAAQSYVSPFRRSFQRGFLAGSERHDFDAGSGVDGLLDVTIPVGATLLFVLQWNEPFFSVSGPPGAATDIDVLLYTNTGSVVAGSVTDNVGGDAIEALSYTNPGPGTAFRFGFEHQSGPYPSLMKALWYGPMTLTQYATNSSTIFGHPNAAGARAVGAAYYASTPVNGVSPAQPETFTSTGGTPILFSTTGGAISVLRSKPEIVAPDGVDNTLYGTDVDGTGRPNFFGTSAAAPHAAGVAALLLELAPTATPARIHAALQDTALDMAAPGTDALTGSGLLDAVAAADAIASAQSGNTVGFSSLPSGQPIGTSVPLDAFAPLGLSLVVNGNSSGNGILVAATTGGTLIRGNALDASATPGSSSIELQFAAGVSAVDFAFASTSGTLHADVLEPNGMIRRSQTITGSQTVLFADGNLLGGRASITDAATFTRLRLRPGTADPRLRVDDVRWIVATPETAVIGDAPLPPWLLIAMAGAIFAIARRRLNASNHP